jgi:type IV secretion system protein VirB11
MKKDYKKILKSKKILEANSEHFFKYVTDDIREIYINKPKKICVITRDGETQRFEDENLTTEYVERFVRLFALYNKKRYCRYTNPVIDFDFCGIRFQVFGSEYIGENHITLTARINTGPVIPLDELIYDSPNFQEILNILKSWVKNRKTFLIAGSTGTGKTTLMNALLSEIDQEERIISIESVRELKFTAEAEDNIVNIVYDERKSFEELKKIFNGVLRSSPQRIIVGEIRQENVAVFLQAIKSGHEGSIGTIHADSLQESINTIVTYSGWSGEKMNSSHDIVQQLSSRLEGVVILKRTEKGVSISLETNGNTPLYQDNIVNIEGNSKFLERVNL